MTRPADGGEAAAGHATSGYTAELRRTLNGFQLFAVSFASVSVIMGIFATYDDVLRDSGPVGIWLFPLIGVGQLLVALIYAQFAARIPLSGSSYAWASRLANPRVGWAFGWMALLCSITAPAAINIALSTQCLMPLFGIPPDETTGRLIAAGLLVAQGALAVAATTIVGWVNSLSAGVELGILVLLGSALTVAILVTGNGSASNLFSLGEAAGNPDYWAIGGGLMAASLMGLNTLVGFESAANMSEEATNPTRDVPRAIIGSVLTAGGLGFVFLVVLTAAITDIPAATASESSVAEVMREQFGSGLERPFLAAIAVAFFGAALVAIASTSRYIFAMSRDRRFPGHPVTGRVNARTQTPIPATLLVVAVGLVLLVVMPGEALLQLIATGAIINIALYIMTVVLYLAVRHRFDRGRGGFDLGRWEWPVAVGALGWVVVSLVAVLTAATTWASALIVTALVLPGVGYWLYMWRFDPAVLATEPGADALPTDR